MDKRADIWAFGVVLYEMLTGHQLFSGDTVSDTLAAVLKEEPDWEKVPAKARPLLRRCLEKDPKKRLRDIGDAYALLETAPESPPSKRAWLAWGIAGASALALAISVWAPWRSKPPASEPIRFQIPYPDNVSPGLVGGFALSPDGRHLAFLATDSNDVRHLWIRNLQSLEIRSLSGTESANDHVPFWSPDSRFVLYTALDPKTRRDIWVLPMENGGTPKPFLRTEFNERDGRFSPDMRWIAYVSDKSGKDEVYVRGFSQASPEASTETGGMWQIGSGTEPRWREDGKELFYLAPDRKIMAVDVATVAVFSHETPKELFQAPADFSLTANLLVSTWDVTADGKRFLLPAAVAESALSPFNVILNWTSLLKK